MIELRKAPAFLAAAVTIALSIGTAAWAQATRTWVSGVGDDANPCSRTAPCKTFAGAISKTATGGEINCLDPGGFGGVTITKSISIVCDYTEGGILSAGAGVNGIVINLPSATDTVFLSGLDFNGAGSAQNGIRIVSGGNVRVQNSLIRNYRAANGLGMSVQPAGSLNLTISNTTIADNGVTGAPGSGGGILIQPTGVGGTARVTLTNVRMANTAAHNLRIDTAGSTNATGIRVTATDVEFNGATAGVVVNGPAGTQGVSMLLTRANVFNNTVGLNATGSGAELLVTGSSILGNGTGLQPSGGVIRSYGDNIFVRNTVDGNFTLPNATKS